MYVFNEVIIFVGSKHGSLGITLTSRRGAHLGEEIKKWDWIYRDASFPLYADSRDNLYWLEQQQNASAVLNLLFLSSLSFSVNQSYIYMCVITNYSSWDILGTQQMLDIITVTILNTMAWFQVQSSKMILGI